MHTFLDERDRLEIDNRIKKVSSNSITVKKEGNVLNITDGANEPLKGLKVLGKTEQKSVAGNQLLNIDGNFIVNSDGTIQKNSSCYSTTIKVEGVNNIYISGDFTLLNSGTVRVGLLNEEPTEQSIATRVSVTTSSNVNVSGYSYVLISFGVYGLDTTVEQIKNSFMVNKGMTALPWEPYVGGIAAPNPEYPQELVSVGGDGNVEVGVYGKNLFKKATNTKTSNGVTFTPNNDGSVTVNGTAQDGHAFYYLEFGKELEVGQTYTLSGCPLGGASDKYALQINFFPADHGNGATDIIIDNREYGKPYILVNKGYTANNIIFKPMFRLASIHDDTYEPYKPKQSLTISTPNGLPGIPVSDESLATYTDENGQMWCSDEKDYERGVYIQRVGVEVLTTLSMHEETSDYPGRFVRFLTLNNRYLNGTNPVVSNKFYFGGWGLATNNKWIISLSNSMLYIAPPKGSGYTVDALNVCLAENISADNPLIIAAILETPIETPLSEEEIDQYKKLTMNHPTTTILNDSNAHMEVRYIADVQNHIEQNYVSKEAAESLLLRVSNIENHMV